MQKRVKLTTDRIIYYCVICHLLNLFIIGDSKDLKIGEWVPVLSVVK